MWIALALLALALPGGMHAQTSPMDSLQLMIGSWEMVTFSSVDGEEWLPAEGVAHADWSFGPAADGSSGGIDGLGDLTLDHVVRSGSRIRLRGGGGASPVVLDLSLRGDGPTRFRGEFVPGDQLILSREGVGQTGAVGAGSGRQGEERPLAGPEPEDTEPRLPAAMRLVIEERDRFVLILERVSVAGRPPAGYLLWEFQRHQTQE